MSVLKNKSIGCISVLDNAIGIAHVAHKGQTDLGGNLYILHPIFVMGQMNSLEGKIVSILHDVTEDTEYTLDDVMCEITQDYTLMHEDECGHIRRALWLLDKKNHKDYDVMIEKIASDMLARDVKIEDIKHNMDVDRIIGRHDMTDKDQARVHKYMKSLSYLESWGDVTW